MAVVQATAHSGRTVSRSLLVVVIGSVGGWERSNAQHSLALVKSLVKAEPLQVKGYIDQVADYCWWTRSILKRRFDEADDDSLAKVYLGLALLRIDDGGSSF